MSSTRVLIIGAGIAGPPLATLLKMKGYDPIVFERTDGPSGGLGLGIASNGQAVLGRIPGLMEEIRAAGIPAETIRYASVLPEDYGILSEFSGSVALQDPTDPLPIAIRRAFLLKTLATYAEKAGVPLRWGHNMESLEQTENGVKVRFTNGVEEEGSFVVGCDGLHSNVRKALFGYAKSDFTGLACCGGFAPVPEAFKNKAVPLTNIFGNNAYMLFAKLDEDTMFWSCATREEETKEAWRAMDDVKTEDFKENSIFANWHQQNRGALTALTALVSRAIPGFPDGGFHGGEIIKTGYNIIRFGLYDRPELKTWHKGRVILVGDAAHPTSPHVGQGANQSLEDIGRLFQLLEKHNPSAESPTTTLLGTIFSELEAERISKTAALVKGARAMGDTRVVEGVQACVQRNNAYREMAKDPQGVRKKMMMRETVAPTEPQ